MSSTAEQLRVGEDKEFGNEALVEITEDEAALYDRQIRLWGLDAQKRLRGATVLLIGLSGVGAEVAKNIILAGVKSIVLMDSTTVTEEDKCFQFLIDRKDIGKNRAESSRQRAQLLNPMVEVRVDTDSSESKPVEFFHQFSVVCATGCTLSELQRLDDVCRESSVKFFAGDVFGFYSYMFSDLNHHAYSEEVVSFKRTQEDTVDNSGEPTSKKPRMEKTLKTVKKTCEFQSLRKALDVDWTSPTYKRKLRKTAPHTYFIIRVLLEFRAKTGRLPGVATLADDKLLLQSIRSDLLQAMNVDVALISDSFTEHCVSQFNPVCAVLGGVLAAEMIKAVSQQDTPINNFFLYNGLDGCGSVHKLGS